MDLLNVAGWLITSMSDKGTHTHTLPGHKSSGEGGQSWDTEVSEGEQTARKAWGWKERARVRHCRSSSSGEMSEREWESETGDMCVCVCRLDKAEWSARAKVGKRPKKYGVPPMKESEDEWWWTRYSYWINSPVCYRGFSQWRSFCSVIINSVNSERSPAILNYPSNQVNLLTGIQFSFLFHLFLYVLKSSLC